MWGKKTKKTKTNVTVEDIDSTASSSFVLDIQLAVKGKTLLLSYHTSVDIYESSASLVCLRTFLNI